MSTSTPHESMLPSQARAGTIAPAAQGSAEGTMAAKRLAAPPWHRIALAGVLLLAALLNFWWLNREGFSNLYYAATVRSMLSSWHNFLYASYDPGGFVSVDKPPLGLWIQAASAMLFGFRGLSLLLPQALAGVLCVGVLYHLVRRPFGVAAGLLAALMLALTPVNVATNRNNTMDSLLVLALLLAAWAVSRAAESGRLRLLILGMVLVGVGFNVKMLQAYLALPAFYLVYLVGAPLRRRTRLAHLALATVVLLGVSLSWALAVDLTPPDRRPYVGGSTNNRVLDLIVGYNGLARLLPGGLLPRGMAAAPQPAFAPGPRPLPQGPAGIAPAPQSGAGGPPGMAGPAPAGGFIV
ncbi:MAG TPA: glycosyltransferase family 39 protein, partial [Ardenticatenaceae bacterium]|nr:glycosyltransferase family 39 protein [Ardenticatenaceae bacterium]